MATMNRILVFLVVVDLIYLGTGGMLIGLAVKTKGDMNRGSTRSNVAENLLLMNTPWTGAIANGAMIAVSFMMSIPGLALQSNRGWLKAFGWSTILSAIFTLGLGLDIWFSTLKTRSNLRGIWAQGSPQTQSLLQQRFNCCGYLDAATPPFQQDATCTNAFVAAQKQGCMGPFSDFANGYLDRISTAIFGMVALDVILLLSVAVLLKDRLEKARFRLGDLKHGLRSI
ncbi:MAG: assembly factor cbp4 [Watsoniomyces obsoletus]|nr:MAG: assembly factor cbp4 [Watsoniomyces obsoletus]